MSDKVSVYEIFIFPFVFLQTWIISFLHFIIQFIHPNYKTIQNKVTLITGAANGLGRELCHQLAGEGCKILAVDIDEFGLLKTYESILEQYNKRIRMFICDIRQKSNISKLFDTIESEYGRVDIVISNAGVVKKLSILDTNETDHRELFDINYYANVNITKKFLPKMLLNDDGHLVYISSVTSSLSATHLSTYCSTKAALSSFVESLYIEIQHLYKKFGVKVTLVSPFLISTGLFKNCKSRLPWIFPPLTEKHVTERIIHGIKRNQYHVVIGRLMNLILILKAILPMSCLMELLKFSGGISIMDDYNDIRSKIRQEAYSHSSFKEIVL